MSGRTSAFVYGEHSKETAYAGGLAAGASARVFGLEQSISPIRINQNIIPLQKLNQNTIDQYAYGRFEGSYSMGFVLSNPWWVETILDGDIGTTLDTPVAGVNTHTFDNDKTKNKSIETEAGFDAGTTDVVRNLLGGVITSVNLTSALNQVVRGRADITYGKENAPTTALDSTPASDDINFPYTFEHGTFELPNGTVLGEVQSFEMTLNSGKELIYEHGNKFAVGTFKGLLDLRGRFTITVRDPTQLNNVLNRTEVATLGMKFDNGQSGASEESADFVFTGVGMGEHDVSFDPNALVLENLPLTMRLLTVTAINAIDTPPA